MAWSGLAWPDHGRGWGSCGQVTLQKIGFGEEGSARGRGFRSGSVGVPSVSRPSFVIFVLTAICVMCASCMQTLREPLSKNRRIECLVMMKRVGAFQEQIHEYMFSSFFLKKNCTPEVHMRGLFSEKNIQENRQKKRSGISTTCTFTALYQTKTGGRSLEQHLVSSILEGNPEGQLQLRESQRQYWKHEWKWWDDFTLF